MCMSEEEVMEYTCILCPRGCHLTAEWVEDAGGEKTVAVSGNFCPRGVKYATEEMTQPMRTVTTSCYVLGGDEKMVSAKTNDTIPKAKIEDVLAEAKKLTAHAPLNVGDVLISNVAGTGRDLVATRKIVEA